MKTNDAPLPKLGPKDFAPHLLYVLGELTGGKIETPVAMQKTFGPICKRLNIDETAFGRAAAHGSLWTHRQIGFAMKLLRHTGHTAYQSRGHWMLTDLGLRVSLRDAETPKKSPRTPRPPAVETPRPEANVIFFRPSVAESIYDQDQYLRRLAIQQTTCWGHHSTQDMACRRCLLAASCATQLKEALVVIAARLTADDVSPELADKRRRAAAIQELKQSMDPRESTDALIERINTPPAKALLTKGEAPRRWKAKSGSVCSHCQIEIPEGTSIIWARTRGSFHEGCVECL